MNDETIYLNVFEKMKKKKQKKLLRNRKALKWKNQIISFYRMKEKMYSIFFVELFRKILILIKNIIEYIIQDWISIAVSMKIETVIKEKVSSACKNEKADD